MSAWAAALLLCQSPRVEAVELEEGWRALAALARDLDADGREDLVLVAGSVGGTALRELLVFRARGAEGISHAADARIALAEDVSAFALGDVHADPGLEIVLFFARGAAALRPAAHESERYVRLAAAEVLWQLAESEDILSWQAGVRDLDGDGLVDLILPEAGGLAFARQVRDAEGTRSFTEPTRARAPSSAAEDTDEDEPRSGARRGVRGGISFGLRLGGGAPRFREPLLVVEERSPVPRFLDVDADGRRDLLVFGDDELRVHRQDEHGVFSAEADQRLALPLGKDHDESVDFAFRFEPAELDLDGRADALLVTRAPGDKIATQIHVYLSADATGATGAKGAPPFGSPAVPSQLLLLLGLASLEEIVDVDLDGRLDLVCSALRTDRIADLVRAGSAGLEGELYVFLNGRRGIDREADLVHRVWLTERSEGFDLFFAADANGDSLAELAQRDERGRLSLRHLVRTSAGLALEERAFLELALDEDAEVRGEGEPFELPRMILVLEERLVRLVRLAP